MRSKTEYYKPPTFKDVPPVVKKNGILRPNPFLYGVVPHYLTLDNEQSTGVPAVAVSANSTERRVMSNDVSGYIAVDKLMAKATSDSYLVQLYDPNFHRNLSNSALHAETFLGNGDYPFKLPYPLILDHSQQVEPEITDLSGSTNTIEFAFSGHRFFWDVHQRYLDKINKDFDRNYINARPFFYTTTADIQLTGNGTGKGLIKILDDADFLLHRITVKSDGIFRVRPVYNKTFEAWSNADIHSDNFGGNNLNYWDFEQPMLIERKKEVELNFTDLSGSTNNIYVTLTGVHYYYERHCE